VTSLVGDYLKHTSAHKNIVGICNMEIEAETEFKKHLISNWGLHNIKATKNTYGAHFT
jgi:hypothetical protein